MVSTRGVQEGDVWGAADALLLEGARPTIERIRQRLGRGSPNTVGPILDAWFKGLGARIQDPGAFAAAPETPDPVAQAARYFWEAALATARGEVTTALAAERDGLDEIRRALESRSGELDRQAQELLHRSAAEQETLQLARRQLSELGDQNAFLQRRLDTLEKDLATGQAQSQAAAIAYEELRTATDDERRQWDLERRELEQRAADQQRHWLQEIDRGRSALKTGEIQLGKLRDQLESARASRLEADSAERQTRIDLERERVTLRATRDALQEQKIIGQRQEQALHAQLNAQAKQLAFALGALGKLKVAGRPTQRHTGSARSKT